MKLAGLVPVACASGVLASGFGSVGPRVRGEAAADTAVVVDAFESISSWSTNPSQGVEVSLHSDVGFHGRGMRVDFDFHGHQGYGIVRRPVSIDLPENYEFRFAVRGTAPVNTLELKLVDGTGANVWWSNNRNFAFPSEWRTITRGKLQICFGWGPTGAQGDIRHVSAIEFAITAGSGGKGSVWFDDLLLAPLRVNSPFDAVDGDPARPIVGSWESPVSRDATGGKLDFASDGTFTSTLGVMAGFKYSFSEKKLKTEFAAPDNRNYEFTNEISFFGDSAVQKGTNLFGRDIVFKRVGAMTAAATPLSGVWRFVDYTGPTSFVEFGENGTGLFRIPRVSCSGTWTEPTKGHIVVDLNGQIAERDYSIENGILVLRYSGSEIRYTRRSRAP